MINRRYGAPYSYLSRNIRKGRFNSTVTAILNQREKDAEWDLYCACVANPFADKIGSFEEFSKSIGRRTEPVGRSEKDLDVKAELNKASNILSGFTPPAKGGD